MPTLFLVVYAAVIATIISIPTGIISALRRGRCVRPDRAGDHARRLRDAGLLARDHPDPDLLDPPAAVSGERLRQLVRRASVPPVPAGADDFDRLLDDPRADAPLEHARRALVRLRRHGADQGDQPLRGAAPSRLSERDRRRDRRVRDQPRVPDQRHGDHRERLLDPGARVACSSTRSRRATTRSCRGSR